MNRTVQPDIFGEYDDALAKAEADAQPQTCPHCGTVEPNAFLLRNNHWPDSPRARTDGMCTAQQLTRNHIWWAVEKGSPRLDGYLERGRALGLDVEAIQAQVHADE